MRKLTQHTKTPLFLMEMIFSLLILSLTAAACIQLFAAAYKNRQQAREWNKIQELTTNTCEILESADPNPKIFSEFLPGSFLEGNTLTCYYNRQWEICHPEDFFYKMTLLFSEESQKKSMTITFHDLNHNLLYQLPVSYPRFTAQQS